MITIRPPMYNSYANTSTLPDICKTVDSIKHPEKCTGVNTNTVQNAVNKLLGTKETWHAPTFPNDYKVFQDAFGSTSGNSKIKADNKDTKGIAPTTNRNTPFTSATLNNIDTSDDDGGFDIKEHLPLLLLGGGAVVMMMLMMTMF